MVKQYSYVGVVFTPNGKFRQNQTNLKHKAMKALFSLRKSILCEKMLNPKLCLKLFDSLIVPILSYASEIWSTEVTNNNNCLEKLCMSYFRFILGVSKQTACDGVRAELGRFPLKVKFNLFVIKYWFRLNSLPENNILKKALKENIEMNSPWAKFIHDTLGSYNHIHAFNLFGVKSYSQLYKKLKVKFTSEFVDTWKRNLFDDSRKNGGGNKLRTYRIFKTEFNLEKYLEVLSDFTLRRALSKFRLSDHNLGIELGRRCKPKLPVQERTCQRCNSNEIDDEFHLLFSCKSHISERMLLCQRSDVDISVFCCTLKREENTKRAMECNYRNLAIFIKSTDIC